MKDKTVAIVEYLTKDEANEIQAALHSEKITSSTNTHGPTSKHSQSYYQILIEEKDQLKASGIIKAYQNKKAFIKEVKKQVCPQCKSKKIASRTNLNLFQKLLYLGTEPMVCLECEFKWGA